MEDCKRIVLGVTASKSHVLLKSQLKFYVSMGYEVYFMSPYSEDTEFFCLNEGARFIPINIRREIHIIQDVYTLFVLIKKIRKISPHIVNFGTPKMGLLGGLASYLLKIDKRIYTCRGFRFETEHGFKKGLLKYMERLSGKCAHKILCISLSLKTKAIKEHIFPEKKIVIINKGSSNGVDLNLFSKNNINEKARKKIIEQYSLSDSFVFGFVGRIAEEKGIKELYQAFCTLREKYINIKLLLIGGRDEFSPECNTLMNSIEQDTSILYLGKKQKEELGTYFSIFDVFVLPTWREGFGNVLIEAAAMGVPIITNNVTGAKDAVSNGFNGILVEKQNVDQLFTAMEKLYLNTSLRIKLGLNGLEWARNFDQQTIWNGMLSLYK